MAIFKPIMNIEYILSLNDLVGEPTSSRVQKNPDGSPKEQVILKGQLYRPTKEPATWYADPWKLERIVRAGIQPGEAFKLVIMQNGNKPDFTVTRLTAQDSAPQAWEQVGPPQSDVERQLAASIAQAEARKARALTQQQQVTAAAPPANRQVITMPSPTNSSVVQQQTQPKVAQTLVGEVLTSALLTAIDSVVIAGQYADSKGFRVAFTSEDVRAMALTIVINLTKNGIVPVEGRSSLNPGAPSWNH